MDENLKRDFEHLCGEPGMNMTTASNIFTRAMVRQNGLPFEVSLDFPNAETRTTIEEANSGRNLSKWFHSVEELREDLNA